MLILGGTGFIGKHLCEAVSKRGTRAVVASRGPDRSFLAEYAPGVAAMSLADLSERGDSVFAEYNTLVYLASTSVPATFEQQPARELSANVAPAFEIFDRAQRANPYLRIIFVSSGGTVYGAGHAAPIRESAPARPISAYGYGKLATEEALRFLGRTRGLSHAILRVSNPVGRWQSNPAHGIVTVALRAALRGEGIKLFNGGVQVRDFIDADDVADAILSVAGSRDYTQSTWNIGSGVGRRILEVVDLVEAMTGLPIARTNLSGRAVDVPYSVLDCGKAQRELNWTARTPLEATISSIQRAWEMAREESLS